MKNSTIMHSVEIETETLKPYEMEIYEIKFPDASKYRINRVTLVSSSPDIKAFIAIYVEFGKNLLSDHIKDRVYNKITNFNLEDGTAKIRVVNEDLNNNMRFKVTLFGDKIEESKQE